MNMIFGEKYATGVNGGAGLGDSIYNQELAKNTYIKDWQKNDFDIPNQNVKAGWDPQAQVTPASQTASSGFDASKGDGAQDQVGNALMSSGNPYAAGAGAVLKLDEQMRKNAQAKMDASRKAYTDWYDRQLKSDNNLISTNWSV